MRNGEVGDFVARVGICPQTLRGSDLHVSQEVDLAECQRFALCGFER